MFFVSCGKKLDVSTILYDMSSLIHKDLPPEISYEKDSYFDSMTEKFLADSKNHGVSEGKFAQVTVIKFDDSIDPAVYGVCLYQTKNGKNYHVFYKEIKFSFRVKELSPLHQYKIFLHEIGHCAYHLPHAGTIDSVMYAYTASPQESLWENVLSEFFDSAKSSESSWGDESSP